MKKISLTILNICLLGILVWICVSIFSPKKSSLDNTHTEKINAEVSTEDSSLSENVIPAGEIDNGVLENLFDNTNDNAVQEIEDVPSKPTLPSGIYLKGTITGPESIARAMISVQGEDKTMILKTGEKLGGFVIKDIQKDYVVLTANKQEVKLWIQSGNGKTIQPESTQNIQETVISEPLELAMPKTRENLVKTLDSLNLDAQWEIVEKSTSGSNDEGLKISNIKPLSPIALLGVKPNDTIVSINGQKLSNIKKTYQVLQKAKLQNKLSIIVKRDGNEIKFDSDINNTEEK